MGSTIIVIGSVNMDLVVRAKRMPKEGESLIGSGFTMVPGGKGANQAVAAARLGSTTHFVGRVGNDMFGTRLKDGLSSCGVNTDHVLVDDGPSGIAMIILNESGQNSIVVAPGANAHCRPEDLRPVAGLFGRADFLLLQLEIPLKTIKAALDMAHAAGLRSVLDAGPAQKVSMNLLRKAHIVSPNETEAFALTDIEVNDVTSARNAAKKLLDGGVETVVMKLGGQGALVVTPDLDEHVPPFAVDAVDTTAAGDAFTGALAVALADGTDLADAVRFANAAGALAVTRLGAQPSMPTRESVERFMAERVVR
jgi:ribokinase